MVVEIARCFGADRFLHSSEGSLLCEGVMAVQSYHCLAGVPGNLRKRAPIGYGEGTCLNEGRQIGRYEVAATAFVF